MQQRQQKHHVQQHKITPKQKSRTQITNRQPIRGQHTHHDCHNLLTTQCTITIANMSHPQTIAKHVLINEHPRNSNNRKRLSSIANR